MRASGHSRANQRAAAPIFAPASTIRYRQIFRGTGGPLDVPDYPAPGVEIDYYLPEAVDELRLEIVAADGRSGPTGGCSSRASPYRR